MSPTIYSVARRAPINMCWACHRSQGCRFCFLSKVRFWMRCGRKLLRWAMVEHALPQEAKGECNNGAGVLASQELYANRLETPPMFWMA